MQVIESSAANLAHRSNSLKIASLFGAIAVFVGLSSWLLPIAVAKIFGAEIVLDESLSAALLLNIALILLIWRGSQVLSRQTKVADDAQCEVDIVAVKDYPRASILSPEVSRF